MTRSASCSSTRRTCAPSAVPRLALSWRRRPGWSPEAMPTSVLGRRSVSGGAFFWNALLFTRALRAAGLSTSIGAAIDFSRALTLIDIGERDQVRAAGMAIFVRRRDEVPVYEEVFTRFWQRHELAIDPLDLDFGVELSLGDE